MKILVCSAGYVGVRVAQKLKDSNHDVEILRRSKLPVDGFKTHHVDLSEGAVDLGGFDCVFLSFSPSEFSRAGYEKAFITSYENLLKSIDMSRLQSIFMVSSTSVFGQMNEQLVLEADVNPNGFSGEVLLEAERCLAGYGKRLCVLRLSGIYGPERLSVLQSVKEVRATYSSGLSHFTNRIHIDDVVGFSNFAINNQLEGTFNVSDSEPVRRNDLLSYLADLCNVNLETAEQPPSKRRTNKKVCNKKMLQTGYELKFPSYKQAYSAMVKI